MSTTQTRGRSAEDTGRGRDPYGRSSSQENDASASQTGAGDTSASARRRRSRSPLRAASKSIMGSLKRGSSEPAVANTAKALASARRHRSRSPLRAVQKSARSILGSLKRGSDAYGKVPDLSLDEDDLPPEQPPSKDKDKPIISDSTMADSADKGANSISNTLKELKETEDLAPKKTEKEKPAEEAAEKTAGEKAQTKTEAEACAAEEEKLEDLNSKQAAEDINAPSFTSRPPSGPLFQIVILLLDIKTRRYEFLRLNFDPNKAIVGDVISQIALSAEEESLREQKYEGICDQSGDVAESSKTLLSDFCRADDVILAIPENMEASECLRLAKPILSDPRIVGVLHPPLEEKKPSAAITSRASADTASSSRSASDAAEIGVKAAAEKAEAEKAEAEKAAAEKVAAEKAAAEKMAAEKAAAEKAAAEKAAAEKAAAEKAAAEKAAAEKAAAEKAAAEEVAAEKAATEKAAAERAAAEKAAAEKAAAEKAAAEKAAADKEAAERVAAATMKEEEKSRSSGLFGIIIPVIFAAILYRLHENITAPLNPGDVLAPGRFRSRCGVLSILPESITGCKPALMKIGEDGKLSMYQFNTLAWTMIGGVCPTGDDDCYPGVFVDEDGKVFIGGKKVKVSGDVIEPLNPWPFAIDPNRKKGFGL